MKKFFVLAVVFCIVLCAGSAFADDVEKMTIDDVTFGKAYKIKGYAVVTFQEFKFSNTISRYNQYDFDSGNEADYACLRADIRNLGKKETKFLGAMAVKVVYDDEYEYNGFTKQYNYDKSSDSCVNDDTPIGPMYSGHYGFFCTLPNFIVQDKSAPLRMIITINGHDFIYHIRK